MTDFDEESLGTTLHRKFQDVSTTLKDFTSEASRLRTQCEELKSQKSGLTSEIERLANERDSLRIEHQAMVDALEWWQRRDIINSSNSNSSAPQGRDEKGRAIRKAYIESMERERVEAELKQARRDHEEQIEGERAISMGLRDRVGVLEGRLREKVNELEKYKDGAEEAQNELKEENTRLKGSLQQAQQQRSDVQEALVKSQTECTRIKKDLENLRARDLAIVEEGKKLLAEINKKTESRANDRPTIPLPVSPSPRPLRILSPNIQVTPPRSSFSSTSTATPSKTQTTPTQSLAQRFAHLEDRYATLRKEYESLRERYAKDIQHWKEYKAVQVARSQMKKKRKEEKRSQRGISKQPAVVSSGEKASGSASIRAEEIEFTKTVSSEHSQVVEEEHQEPRSSNTIRGVVVEEMENESEEVEYQSIEDRLSAGQHAVQVLMPVMTSGQPASQIHLTTLKTTEYQSLDQDVLPQHDPQLAEPEGPLHSTPQQARNRSNRDTSAPPPTADTTRKAVAQAARTTPWLRSKPRLGPSRSHSALAGKSGDSFEDEMEATSTTTTITTPARVMGLGNEALASTSKTPLVRDRGGDTTSLRKTILQKTATGTAGTGPLSETPSKSSGTAHPGGHQNMHTPGHGHGHGHGGSGSGSAVSTPSGTKRKYALVTNMEELTPDEKALERKRLNRLSAQEKREIYAEYKGKGRYIAPEEVRKEVREEYEIDKTKNEGANYAFHDVKRKKAERKNMHGGDCECCKNYYEAVGEIPRFNQAPKWNDAAPTPLTGEEAIQQHQNQISRHRDTWERTLTPPGYWHVGFPSTQDVAQQNEIADQMIREKEAKIRKEASSNAGKWKKKT